MTDDSPVPRYADLVRLDGQGFVVLGAGQGIGRQACHALAQAGAQVLCVDTQEAAVTAVATEMGGVPCVADVTTRAGMESVFALAASRLQRPGGVVDIVGRAHIGPIARVDDEAYRQQVDLVFRHAWLAVQLGGEWLVRAGGGSIVLIGSLSGEAALPNQALYGSQKAALHHLGRCAAVEYGPQGVRVNTVAPGPTRTPRLLELMGDDWSPIEQSTPLRRAAEAADIASVVLFLASPLARHVTGQVIVVDGGSVSTISRPPARHTAPPSEQA